VSGCTYPTPSRRGYRSPGPASTAPAPSRPNGETHYERRERLREERRNLVSTIARGRITSVSLDFDQAGFTVVDYRDIPGRNGIALIHNDQPCRAETEVRHTAEPILLHGHEDREKHRRPSVSIA